MHLMQEGNADFLAFSESFSLGATVICIVLLLHPQTEQGEESDSSLVSPCISFPDKVEYLCFVLRS